MHPDGSLQPQDIEPLPGESAEAFALRQRLLKTLPTWSEIRARAGSLTADDLQALHLTVKERAIVEAAAQKQGRTKRQKEQTP